MKEALFKSIRQGEVVLWAGSGLSLYAGYPSGTELRDIIYKSLEAEEQKLIDSHSSLMDLAEDYVRLKGGKINPLIQLLNQIFLNTEPTSTKVHEIIAQVPHFKQIVTTNYDLLFEKVFNNSQQVIFKDLHIPYINRKKIQIYKVHGDLSDPYSIILTKSQYQNFFKSDSNNHLWTAIRDLLAKNTVVFVGYNLEDMNVSVIFEKIQESLGSHLKQSFLLAPSLPRHKVEDLARKGIQYIDSTAEVFFSELIQNIKDNIISDFDQHAVEPDVFRKFFIQQGLQPNLSGSEEGFKLTSISSPSGLMAGQLEFSMSQNSSFTKKLQDIVSGKTIGKVIIPEAEIKNLKILIGDIKYVDGAAELHFETRPAYDGLFDILFSDGLELSNLSIKIYVNKDIAKFHVQYEQADFIICMTLKNFPLADLKMQFTPPAIFTKTKNAIDLYNFIMHLGVGISFKIPYNGNKLIENALPTNSKFVEDITHSYEFLLKLKKIEMHYGIWFHDISLEGLTGNQEQVVNKIISFIEHRVETILFDGILSGTLIYSEASMEQITQINSGVNEMQIFYSIEEVVELFGQSLKIGYKEITIEKPYVENLNEIIAKKATKLIVKSRTNKARIKYLQEPPQNLS